MKTKKYNHVLIFKDLISGEVWEHGFNDWILNFCNFNSSIHPSLLKAGQSLRVRDNKGHEVEINCVKRKAKGDL